MIRRLRVVVPAANEAASIRSCLAAVTAARSCLARSGAQVQVEVIVVLDGCDDRTAEIAAAAADVRLLSVAARNVGAARRAGAVAALSGAAPSRETWLASTDADSQVPVTWLAQMVTEARRGAHLVLGTVLPAPGLQAGVHAQWHSRHQLREGHPHVHGANFGIRGDAYLMLGGWLPLACGEDAALAARAAAAGLRICRTAAIPVTTSIRADGRAPRGFSGYLRDLTAAPAARGHGSVPARAVNSAGPGS